MDFEVGDKVMHPAHGGGCVVATKDVELVEGYEHYYQVEFRDKELTLHVPMRRAEELGLRAVMEGRKLKQVLETLGGLPEGMAADYKVRQGAVRELLKQGNPLHLACAVRDMSAHAQDHKMTTVDSKLLSQARDILAEEIALSLTVPLSDAQTMIARQLNVPGAQP